MILELLDPSMINFYAIAVGSIAHGLIYLGFKQRIGVFAMIELFSHYTQMLQNFFFLPALLNQLIPGLFKLCRQVGSIVVTILACLVFFSIDQVLPFSGDLFIFRCKLDIDLFQLLFLIHDNDG